MAIKQPESVLFDSLRGGAALLVLLAHTQQILINPTWMPFSLSGRSHYGWYIYSQLGALGVMVFFVLSGYLIACSIKANIDDSASAAFDWKRYFKARFNRLMPPLAMSQLLILGIFLFLYLSGIALPEFYSTGSELYVAREKIDFKLLDYLGSWLFLNTLFFDVQSPAVNGPLWSVAQEFWFYAIAGFFVLGFSKRWGFALAAATVFIIAIQDNKYFFYGLAVWLSGAAVAVLNKKNREHLRKHRIAAFPLAILLAALWLYMIQFNDDGQVRAKHSYIFGIFFAVLLFVMTNSEKLEVLTKSRLVTCIASVAGYSYTLYLIHFPLLLTIFYISNTIIIGNPFAVATTAMLSGAAIILISRKLAVTFEDRRFFSRLRTSSGLSTS